MGTTQLFAELLIIGVGGLGWVTLFAVSATSTDWLTQVADVDAALLTVVGLAVAYIMGIIIDRLADGLLEPISERLKSRYFSDRESYGRAKQLVESRKEAHVKFQYGRTRLRVMRGSALNAFLLLAATLSASPKLAGADGGRGLPVASTMLALVGIGCVFAWWRLSKAQYVQLRDLVNLS